MPHLEPDRLVLLALAEDMPEETETAHLAVCAVCRAEMGELRHVAALGAETQGLVDLPAPPERVWDGIAAATAAPVPTVRIRAPRRRWLVPVLAAAVAATIAVAGTVWVTRPATPPVTAQATLAPLKEAPPSARGDAEVLAGDELRVDVSNLPLTAGYYEVWLLNPDEPGKMQSLGSLGDRSEVVLPIPPGTDLNRYRTVDVSAEAHDGNSAHSGDSLLRGTLTR
ncbi:anti-sigma factor [Actinoplanes sp. NPDC051633]|uniref:anti-sigma factor n=1 Tax=Actinoplanes sp. NPDC051633 TaxID=3155670 RepID=UPI00342163AE